MDASSLPHHPRTSGHTEPRQALTDLLELAGSERASAVLKLLRELLLMPAPGGEEPSLLTLEQVAARLQVHPRTIRRAIETGELAAHDLPFRGGLRVRAQALEQWLSEHTAQTRAREPVSLRAHRSGRLELSDL
jgi:excisionase family DNA binding protein